MSKCGFREALIIGITASVLTACGGGDGTPSNSGGQTSDGLHVSVSTPLPSSVVAGRTAVAEFKVTAGAGLLRPITLSGVTVPTTGEVTTHFQAPSTGTPCRASDGTWATLKPGASCSQVVSLTGSLNAKVSTPWTLTSRDHDPITFTPVTGSSVNTQQLQATLLQIQFVSANSTALPTMTVSPDVTDNSVTLRPDTTYNFKITSPSTNKAVLNHVQLNLASWLKATNVKNEHLANLAPGDSVTLSFTTGDSLDFNSYLKEIRDNPSDGKVLSITAANLRGEVIQPDLQVSTTPGSVGNLTLNEVDQAKGLTFTNLSNEPLTIGSISGALPSGVAVIKDSCSNKTVAAGDNCTVSYQASQQAKGSTTVTFHYQDGHNVSYQNQSTLTVKPVTLSVAAASDPIPRGENTTFTITNNGPFSWHVGQSSQFSLVDANGSAVSGLSISANNCVDQGVVSSQNGSNTCTVTVTATSNTEAGARYLKIAKGDNGNLSTDTVSHGFAVDSNDPNGKIAVEVDTDTMLFPGVRRVKMTNIGGSTLTNINATLSDSTANPATDPNWIYDGTNGESATKTGNWCTSSTCADRCTSSTTLGKGNSCYVYIYANPKATELTPCGSALTQTLTLSAKSNGQDVDAKSLTIKNYDVLYAGGEAESGQASIQSCKNGSWTGVDGSPDAIINSFAVNAFGNVFGAGNTVDDNGVAQINTTDGNEEVVLSGDTINDMVVDQSGNFVVGGSTGSDGFVKHYFMDGTTANETFNGAISTLFVNPDNGTLYTAGDYLNSFSKYVIASYADGSWGTLSGAVFNKKVNRITGYDDKLFISRSDDLTSDDIIQYYDGSSWQTVGSSPFANIGTFAVKSLTEIYASDGGAMGTTVKKFNGSDWGVESNINNKVNSLLLTANGTIYAAGTVEGGIKYKENGGDWQKLTPSLTTLAVVKTLKTSVEMEITQAS